MSKKLFVILVFIIIGSNVFADAIIKTDLPIGKSAIQPSVFSSRIQNVEKDYDINYSDAIKEIQQKIKSYPNDYTLYPSLIDLYIKSNQYEKAFKELYFLNSLSQKKDLNKATLDNLTKIKASNANRASQIQDKSGYYSVMALLCNVLRDYPQTEKYLIAASKSPSKNDIYNNAVETIFSSQDDLQAAISSIDKILLQSPSNTTLRRLKAKMLTQLNRNDEAIKEYSYILASKEDNESIYAMYKLLELKNMQEKDILKKIYGSNSNNLEKIYTELANIFEENNDIRNAQLFAEKLTKKFPDNVDGYILLSDIYRRQGKLQESYKVLQTVRDKADNNEAISKYNVLLAKLSDEPVKEADALMNNGLYKQALSVLEGANQENLYVILSSARANYFLNNKQKAFELLNKAMSFYPNNADVFYYFACIFYQEKDIDSARKYLDQVFKLSPNHAYGQHLKDAINKLDADQYVNQILETMEMQNYTEAMRLVNEAISINAKDSNLYYYKGMIYISMNNYSAATAPLYKALQLNPNNSGAYYYLAMAFDNLSEKAQALSYYKKFLASLSSDQYGESEKINYAKSRIQKLQQ